MRVLCDQTFNLAESPRYIDGRLLFTDINDGHLYCWNKDRLETLCDRTITSFVQERSGGLVCGTMEGLFHLKSDGSFLPLAEEIPLKINDMCADPKGRVVFGTNYHSSVGKYSLGSIYVFAHGELRELDYGYHLVNGIGFSPDGTKMYVCDSSIRTIFEYPYEVETGVCGRKKILRRFRMDDGLPDGMAIDTEGNVWTAQWYGGCVICTSPEGEELRRIAIPDRQVSALEFSPEGLFVTSACERGRMDIAPNSYYPIPGIGGNVFLIDTEVGGFPHKWSDIENR